MKALAERIRREAEIAARPGQLDRLTEIANEVERLQFAAQELGKSLTYWMGLAKESTGSSDIIQADGDGDWATVADRMAAVSTRAARRARELADEWEADPHSDLTQRACAALLRARVLGEGAVEQGPHRCGWDRDPYCDGCRSAMRDAGGEPDA